MTAFLIVALIVSGAFAFRYWSRQQSRKRLLSTPLSDHQSAIVAQQVPLTRRLPADLHAKLGGKINFFLSQVEFIGCNELIVTEEMKLSIAAQACLLIVNSDTWYDHLSTILIYPNAFKSRHKERKGYVVNERETVRTGESWSRGPVILSWAHSHFGAMNENDGHNVVFHEFAHQIDDLSGRTNGIPSLNSLDDLKDWAEVFDIAYKAHVRAVQTGHDTVFDPYGASGPQEFFAVAVEAFFEMPKTLKQKEPAVYEQLVMFFRLDPSEWE
jgi:Mlc titration factor MtfA (ptsG expression regulator)